MSSNNNKLINSSEGNQEIDVSNRIDDDNNSNHSNQSNNDLEIEVNKDHNIDYENKTDKNEEINLHNHSSNQIKIENEEKNKKRKEIKNQIEDENNKIKLLQLQLENLENEILNQNQIKSNQIEKISSILNKLNQINFINQNEESLNKYSIDTKTKEDLLKKLASRKREFEFQSQLLAENKRKYEKLTEKLFNLENNINSSINFEVKNMNDEKNELKYKINELKRKNIKNIKEIQMIQHSNYYEHMLEDLENELKQNLFKVNENINKISKGEKSINIMKGLFCSIVNEKTSLLSNNQKENIESIMKVLKSEEFNIDDAMNIIKKENNINQKQLEKFKPNTQEDKKRDKLILPQIKSRHNENITKNNKSIEFLMQLNNKVEKNYEMQKKILTKKVNESEKLKNNEKERLESIKDENDLIRTEIEYLNQQIKLLNLDSRDNNN